MSQTSYAIDMSAFGFAGQLADSASKDAISAVAEGAISIGLFACRGTAVGQAKLPAAAGDIAADKALGMVLHDQARESLSGSAAPLVEDKGALSILRRGRAVVKVEETVVAGDAVTIRHAAGGNGVGSFCKTADGSRAALSSARYMSAASANGLAVVEFSLS